jgi:hypothetical protein
VLRIGKKPAAARFKSGPLQRFARLPKDPPKWRGGPLAPGWSQRVSSSQTTVNQGVHDDVW